MAAFRAALSDRRQPACKQRFAEDEPVEGLVRDRARARRHRAAQCLAAARRGAAQGVDADRRRRLRPRRAESVLRHRRDDPAAEERSGRGRKARLERFLTFLWDIGLEVGHTVRTIDDCQRESAADVSVATTLIEARLLAGPEHAVRSDDAVRWRRTRLADQGVLRGQGGRAGNPPSPLSRHGLQPRTQRQGEPRRPARHPDHRLGGEAPLRRRVAR